MADVTMPQLGETVTEGTITKWFKKVGDDVKADEPLFEVSTDKVDTEVPSPVAGTLSEIKAQEGDTIPVGAVIAVVGDAGAAPAPAPTSEEPDAGEAPAATEPAAPEPEPETAAPVASAPSSTPAPPPPASTQPEPTPVRASEPEPVGEAPVDEAPAAPASDGTAPAPAGDNRLLSPVVRRLIAEQRPRPGTDHRHRSRRADHARRRARPPRPPCHRRAGGRRCWRRRRDRGTSTRRRRLAHPLARRRPDRPRRSQPRPVRWLPSRRPVPASATRSSPCPRSASSPATT